MNEINAGCLLSAWTNVVNSVKLMVVDFFFAIIRFKLKLRGGGSGGSRGLE